MARIERKVLLEKFSGMIAKRQPIIGGGAGILLVWLVTVVPQDALPLTMTVSRVILGLLVSVGIGVIAGIVPAVMAANLDPVIAIRAQ